MRLVVTAAVMPAAKIRLMPTREAASMASSKSTMPRIAEKGMAEKPRHDDSSMLP